MKLATDEGQRLLDENRQVQECVRLFLRTESPERILTYPGRFIGAGSHSYTWVIDGNVLIKFSSSTSSHAACELGEPVPPEDLGEQFCFLRDLGAHLSARPEANMLVPDQYFALRNEGGAYMLAQQFMTDRQMLALRLEAELDSSLPEDEAFFGAIREAFTRRLIDVAEGTAFTPMLNDLIKPEKNWIHSGNLLVLSKEPLGPDMSLGIIDQPGTDPAERKRLRRLIESRRKS